MKNSTRVLILAASITAITGCTTSQVNVVPLDQYNADIAMRDAELEQLRADAASMSMPEPMEAELFPPNAQPGNCYARLLTPAEYRDSSESVLIRAEGERIETTPAEYGMKEETLLVKEASTRIEVIPATYKTITERVLVKEASTKLVPYEAEYETVSEEVLDKPAHTVWKRGSGFKNDALQTSYDQSTGEIMCLVEVPATYKTISKRVLTRPAGYNETEIPAEYKEIAKTVIDVPASTREIEIPAEYATISTQVLTREAEETRINIPAEYETVNKREKITEEKLAWAEVICEDNVNASLVTRLQDYLQDTGHYNGPIDGIYGLSTQNGLNSFAERNNLPLGSNYIPVETAMELGLNY